MPAKASQRLRSLFASSAFSKDQALELISASHGKARVRMRAGSRHTQGLDRVHGGVVTALADTAATFAAYSAVGASDHVLTASLAVSFTAGAGAGEILTADAEVVHAGRTTVVAEVEVRAGGRRRLGSGIFTMIRREGGRSG